MKIALIILCFGIGLYIIFQLLITMANIKTETQAYRIIQMEEKFEIRYYPCATMVLVSTQLKSYRNLGNSGIGKMANSILGGKGDKKQIGITAPPSNSRDDSRSSMALVMPSHFSKDNLPKPNSAALVIETSEPGYVAVIKFSGFATATNISKQKEILETTLKKKGISYSRNFRFLGYNTPYQLFERRNEVIVTLNLNS